MKHLYLGLAIIGFILPNIWVTIESVESGNLLLYAYPLDTIRGMFANRISTIFIIDLLMAVLVFFIWSYYESKRLAISKTWMIWILTMLFGLAGGFPLFLYIRQQKLQEKTSNFI